MVVFQLPALRAGTRKHFSTVSTILFVSIILCNLHTIATLRYNSLFLMLLWAPVFGLHLG